MLKAYLGGEVFGSITGGDSPSVLGLHGWGRNHRDLATALGDIPHLAVDLPGFGTSPPPPSVWGAADYAQHLSPLLDELSLPVVIVGHSFGGRIAVHLAAARPGAVGGLVLAGVPLLHREGRPQRPPRRFRLGRALHRLGIISDSRMDELRERYGSSDYRQAEGVMRSILVKAVNESYEAELERITCPVELIWGDADTAAPASIASRAESLLADARLTVIARGDHFTPLTRPDELRAAVVRRLDALAAAPGEPT